MCVCESLIKPNLQIFTDMVLIPVMDDFMNANASEILSLEAPSKADTEEAEQLLIDRFLQTSSPLGELQQMMSSHPTYLQAFMDVQNSLMKDENGPLPIAHRHYIAIMAAARHQCVYLMRLHAQEFILNNGDPAWIEGPSKVPEKLRNLCQVNTILAHRPWLLKKEHIEKLLRGSNNWSLSELMQALIIMIHFHTLCSFIYGCGFSTDQDHPGLLSSSGEEETDYSSDSSGDLNSNLSSGPNLELLMVNMEELKAETGQEEGPSQEERLQRFRSVESQSVEIAVPVKEKLSRKKEAERFVTDLDFAYMDFASKTREHIPTFRVQDYSWEDHGYPLVERLYNNIGIILDKKFGIAFTLTYHTMGHNDQVDTSAFREAIWYYIHCMYGIRHDDYDYNQVNKMLEIGLKRYIKTVTCYPECISKQESRVVMKTFKHSERVHVNFMIMEARMQAELLYALRAVNDYMT